MNLKDKTILQLCAVMADADNHIKNEEILFAKDIFDGDADTAIDEAFVPFANKEIISGKDKVDAFVEVAKSFTNEDKLVLLKVLWNLSICDAELHQKEEILFYKISDALGVSRRETISITQ